MLKAQLNVVLRGETVLTINFSNDEAVNTISERLKKAILDPTGIFTIDMKTANGGPDIVHFLPNREIVRFSVTQFPRVAAPV